jgi:hypothetical protein
MIGAGWLVIGTAILLRPHDPATKDEAAAARRESSPRIVTWLLDAPRRREHNLG